MTLRIKSLLIIGASLLAMAGLIYLISRLTFVQGLEEIEERNTVKRLNQAISAISYTISNLESSNADWASWTTLTNLSGQ
jgi:sensor domain CHASE-containing protein